MLPLGLVHKLVKSKRIGRGERNTEPATWGTGINDSCNIDEIHFVRKVQSNRKDIFVFIVYRKVQWRCGVAIFP